MTNTSIVLNEELNGVELYFDKKPLQNVIETLKSAGFRWHRLKKCWYAKQNDKTLALAQSIAEQPTQIEKAKNNKTYFPHYDSVDDSKIMQSSDIEINTYNSYYFADINTYMHLYRDSALVVDLTNALRPGKFCVKYYINSDDNNELFTKLLNGGIATFKKLYNTIIAGLDIDGITVTTTEQKGINTFSPFVKVKPIKKPKKWTIAHIWKGILSGQIYRGVKNGHYTDDFAHDATVNFQKGSELHLSSLAKELIEHPSGWRVRVDKEENNTAQLNGNVSERIITS